jgi:hypothetical protein
VTLALNIGGGIDEDHLSVDFDQHRIAFRCLLDRLSEMGRTVDSQARHWWDTQVLPRNGRVDDRNTTDKVSRHRVYSRRTRILIAELSKQHAGKAAMLLFLFRAALNLQAFTVAVLRQSAHMATPPLGLVLPSVVRSIEPARHWRS